MGWLLASIGLVVVALAVPARAGIAQESFDDVPADSPYAEAVAWMATAGIATGTAPGVFSPERTVTRGEAAVFLWRMEGEPTAILHRFADIEEPWQQLPVSWMAAEGLTTGATTSAFRPDEPVTRGQMAVFLHRLAGEPPAPPHDFEDTADPALDAAVSWMAAEGITAGVGPGRFGPGQPVTRGELAVFLFRFADTPQPADPEPPPTTTSPREPAPETRSLTLTIDPPAPAAGDVVTISGEGADPDRNVTLSLDDQVVAEVVPLVDGTYSAEVRLAEGLDGMAVFKLSQGGETEVTLPLTIREAAGTGGLPVFYLAGIALLGAVALAVFWRRQATGAAEPPDAIELPEADASPGPTTKVKRSIDALQRRLAVEEPTWTRQNPPLGAAASMEQIGVWEAGLWAVGRSEVDETAHAVVWHSVDGNDWRQMADLGPGYLEAATRTPAGLVVLGHSTDSTEGDDPPGATLWRSDDLTTWSRQDLVGLAFVQSSFDGLVEFGEQLFAYGRNEAGACLWIGGDRWISRRTAGPIDLVLSTERGLFAFGRDAHDRRNVVLVTRDGETWRSLPGLEPFEKCKAVAGTDFDEGIVVLGSDAVNEQGAVWVSDDGINWLRAPAEFGPGTSIDHVVRTPRGLIAVGSARKPGRREVHAAFWESTDGISWTALEGNARVADAFIASAAVVGEQIVCAGRRVGPDGSQGTAEVWTLSLTAPPPAEEQGRLVPSLSPE